MAQQNNKFPLPQDDWDFREIESWEVGFAVYHEFARECRTEMQAISSIVTWDWLKEHSAKGCGLKEAFASLLPDFRIGCILSAYQQALWNLRGDRPWLRQDPKARNALRTVFGPARPLCHVEDIRRFDGDTMIEVVRNLFSSRSYGSAEQTSEWETRSHFRRARAYTLRIDWDAVREAGGLDALVKELRGRLHLMQPTDQRQAGRPKTSIDTLSSLAAWRLHRAGVSWIKANELIKGLACSTTRGLPDYTSDKGWRLAIRRADENLRQFFHSGK